MAKKTPLYDRHVEMGGKMVEFGGFLMPVQYKAGIIAEHMAVRTNVGLFDVSHMGELRLSGPDAVRNIQRLVTADISAMQDGQVKYAIFCNEKGGVVDDLQVCRLSADDYLLVVNAGNRDKDAAWVESHLSGNVKYEDQGDQFGQVALQGPRSKEVLAKVTDAALLPEKYYWFTPDVALKTAEGRVKTIVAQTGYTGEFGYEIYCPAESTMAVWNALLEAGEEFGMLPCGLGARDTLRLEAAMPLYGHELNEEITPKMAKLPCKLDGKDFIGRDAIAALGEPKFKRAGFTVVGRGIVREGTKLTDSSGNEAGWVSSGTHCPYLGHAVCMGYIPADKAQPGTRYSADVRGRVIELEVVTLPFYKIER